MDLETAANIGEALGGLAILVTLLFGLRQIRDWNQTRRFEIAQSVASRFENPLFQYGIAVVVIKVREDMKLEELAALSRDEKDALNSFCLGLNSLGIQVFYRLVPIEIVASYLQQFTSIMGDRLRVVSSLLIENAYANQLGDGIEGYRGGEMSDAGLDWMIWLLDRLDEYPHPEAPAHILHKDWKF